MAIKGDPPGLLLNLTIALCFLCGTFLAGPIYLPAKPLSSGSLIAHSDRLPHATHVSHAEFDIKTIGATKLADQEVSLQPRHELLPQADLATIGISQLGPRSENLELANGYVLNCQDDRDDTSWCARIGWHCTSRGTVATSKGIKSQFCPFNCSCVNPNSAALPPTCLKESCKDVDTDTSDNTSNGVAAAVANKKKTSSIPVITKVTATSSTTPSNTLNFSPPTQLLHEDIMERSEAAAQTAIPAPAPSGVPVQYNSTKYLLSCHDRQDAVDLCSSATLGYFCTATMTLVRNTTFTNFPTIQWCNEVCSCIFADAVPCLNQWNIPFCRQLIDGTVRKADELQVVLAYSKAVYILANGTILIPRGEVGYFPFVAVESGFLHDGTGPSTLWNVTLWNGTASE